MFSVHGGEGVGDFPACITGHMTEGALPPGGYVSRSVGLPPGGGLHPGGLHPGGQHPGGLGRSPRSAYRGAGGRPPRYMGYYGIRYASYWNAFLIIINSFIIVFWENFFSRPLDRNF